MKKICSLILIISIILTGCASSIVKEKETVSHAVEGNGEKSNINSSAVEETNTDTDNPKSVDMTKKMSFTIDTLLPDTIGYGWRYYGSVDYGRTESIVEVKSVDNEKHIIVKGEIDDMSDGESGRDYSFTKTYKIVKDGIIFNHQESKDETEFYLIKEPIEVGNTWEHPWYEDSTGKSEIIEVDEYIVIRTERIDPNPVQSYNLKESVITIEPGIGIIEEQCISMDGFDLSRGLDCYGENILDWLGYYELESNDGRTGYVTIYKMNDKEIAFDLYIKIGEGYENEIGLQKIGIIEGNKATFKDEISVGNGSDSTYTVQAVLERTGDTLKVTTDNITPNYNGSDIILDGVYKKAN